MSYNDVVNRDCFFSIISSNMAAEPRVVLASSKCIDKKIFVTHLVNR